MSDKKNSKFGWLILAIGLVAIIMIVTYFCTFHGKLSANSEHWGDFGSYFGSITGLLAFAGVLYTLYLSNNQNESLQKYNDESKERDLFFKMLDLHNEKVRNIETNNSKGVDAISECSWYLNRTLAYVIVYKFIEKELIKGKTFDDLNQLFKADSNGLIAEMFDNYHITPNEKSNSIFKSWEHMLGHLQNDEVPQFAGDYPMRICKQVIINAHFTIEDLYESMHKVGNILSKRYGNFSEDYFRNLYNIFEITSKFGGEQVNTYKRILRAQISQAESVLCIYNAMSRNSSARMIEHLKDYKVFKNIYKNEVFVLTLSDEEEFLDKLLDISAKKLKLKGR